MPFPGATTSGFSFSSLSEDALPWEVSEESSTRNLFGDRSKPEAQGNDDGWEDLHEDNDHTHPDETAEPNHHTAPNQRRYPPRTCRICLEVVLPTYETPAEGIASAFNPAPKVSYISSDPEDGRLIRPCKCKGSSRYVHEGCLQKWRHADKDYGRRNYWQCPTCGFQYHLTRLKWSLWISSTFMQLLLTVAIMLTTVFVLGFVADPIINMYLDPYDTITSSIPIVGRTSDYRFEDESASWVEHFAKGLASLGLLGFVKAFLAMGPWQWWNLRNSGIIGGGRRRAGGTGRDRLENISWTVVMIGVFTFLYATWKLVRNWSRRTLEKASERVVDVQGDDDDFEEVPTTTHEASAENTGEERKNQ